MFRMAKEHLGADANKILKEIVEQHGYESTNGMPVSVYNQVVSEIMCLAEEKRAERPALGLYRKMVAARKSLPSNGS